MRSGRTPSSHFVGHVKGHSRDYTVSRISGTDSGANYDDATDTEYSELPDPRSLYLYGESERTEDTPAGERVVATLQGYALTTVDIREDDRVTYQGTTYEVETRRELATVDALSELSLISVE